MRVAALSVFPVKGGRGLDVDIAAVEPRGLRGDRRWMLVDANGRFVSQRELPALARLSARERDHGLAMALDGEALEIPVLDAAGPRVAVTIWRDTLLLPEAEEASAWLSRCFDRPLRLVHQNDDAVRPTSPDWSRHGDETSLADGYPILVVTAESLADLERTAGAALGMARFRPNLVVEGAQPWDEDRWARLRVGEVDLDLVKPCARCKVTTVDQHAGVVAGEEPLATLRATRMSADARVPGVLFGWNAIPRGSGSIRVGDGVTVLETREAWALRRSARVDA